MTRKNDRYASRWKVEEIEAAELGRPRLRLSNPIVQGYLEGITQPMYDAYLVAAATAVPKLILFSVPIGGQYNSGGIAAFNKTELYTNMTQNAVLPAPNKLIVRAISVFVCNNVNPVDLELFLGKVLLQFTVNSKLYCEQQVGRFPAGGGSFGSFAYTQGTATDAAYNQMGNGWPDARNCYTLAYGGVPIEQQQTFSVVIDPTLSFEGAFTTKSATASATNEIIGTGIQAIVYLDGTLFRAVQ
jgi:hypothetical protein